MNKKIIIAIVVVVVLVLVLAGVLWQWKGDKLLGMMKASRADFNTCVKWGEWMEDGVFTPEMAKSATRPIKWGDAYDMCYSAFGHTFSTTYNECVTYKQWWDNEVFTPEILNELHVVGYPNYPYELVIDACYDLYKIKF